MRSEELRYIAAPIVGILVAVLSMSCSRERGESHSVVVRSVEHPKTESRAEKEGNDLALLAVRDLGRQIEQLKPRFPGLEGFRTTEAIEPMQLPEGLNQRLVYRTAGLLLWVSIGPAEDVCAVQMTDDVLLIDDAIPNRGLHVFAVIKTSNPELRAALGKIMNEKISQAKGS